MGTEADIERAARILNEGGIVAFPTETVYGLGASIAHPEAVARIFEAKERPFFDPLIVHLGSVGSLDRVARIPERSKEAFDSLTQAFWPGPLTLLLPKRDGVPDLVTSGLPTVGVRVPAHSLARRLLSIVHAPVCAPSANRFGRLSPTLADHVARDLGTRVDFILDGGPCEVGVESTIVTLAEDEPKILRPGGVSREDIERVLGKSIEVRADSSEQIQAPGQLASHYAPRTPLRILRPGESSQARGRIGLLAWSKPRTGYEACEVLSTAGDLREAATRLFAALHTLDRMGLDLIEVEPVPERGLGLAIMNRLRKASHG